MKRMPITNDADQVFTVDLDGQVVRVRLTWQDKGSSWFLSLFDAQENPLLLNNRIKVKVLAISFRLIDFVGDFVAVANNIDADEPGRNAWGTTHNLYYVNRPEKEEIQSAVI